MLDRLAAARAFAAVAQTLNFTRAADLLGVSSGQLSRLIAGLEEETGRRLLHRTTRQVSLTTEGEALLGRVRGFLAEADAIFSKEAYAASELRVAASVPFYNMGITSLVSEFLASHPGVSIRYAATSEPLDLVKDAADVGFQEGTDPPAGYIARPLGRIESWLCASPRYLERFGEPASIGALTGHRLLSLAGCQKTWRFLPSGSASPVSVTVSPIFIANYASALLSACLADGGIAFQPIDATAELVKTGRLRVVLPELRGVPHVMNALVADRLNLSPLVRRFLDFIAAKLPGGGDLKTGKSVFLPVK